ncbi:MAG: non-canonical purine NTP pyrophosphatase, partial [Proteobacteria bacterium]|nr:non-canonical purine NTP pyrophosphatase [Pseudomonadota bacterium]
LVLADVHGRLGDATITSDGTCEGVIVDAPRGTAGFGYDPLFFYPELGATFGELGLAAKSELSHRARAMRAIKPALLQYVTALY